MGWCSHGGVALWVQQSSGWPLKCVVACPLPPSDYPSPCPQPNSQVLLSCSHTFHAACLAAFERFSRQTAGATERSCPLCRCASYEKKRIHDAALLWQHACATRIQAAWRGVLGRRQARALRRLLPPTHPAVLRRWAAEELRQCSKGLVASVDQGAADIEALFAELDATSRACKGVFAALAARCPGVAATATGLAGGGVSGGQLADQPGGTNGSSSSSSSRGVGGAEGQPANIAAAHQEQSSPAPDWEAAIDRFLQREAPECPICLCSLAMSAAQDSGSSSTPAKGAGKAAAAPLAMHGCRGRGRGSSPASLSTADQRGSWSSTGGGSRSSSGGAGANTRSASTTKGSGENGVAVLSCSHAFHSDCLSAFEAFALASDLPPACPCCRASYQRMDLR